MTIEVLLSTVSHVSDAADDVLVLPFEARQRVRQRVWLRSGREAALKLPRGTVLRGGAVLESDCGLRVRVEAALERVSTVHCADARELARIAYHLGNRHVQVEVGDGWLRYLQDPILDRMVEQLGAAVAVGLAPFEPEAGAYAEGHHH